MTSRLLVLSDIHSNLTALQAVLGDAKQYGPYDIRSNAGDSVGYGPRPNQCIRLMQDLDFVSALGNHGDAVIGARYSDFNDYAQAAVRHNKRKI